MASRRLIALALALGLLLPGSRAFAQLTVRDVCRVKGQEENTLQGLGLVVGLKGTGDPDLPTSQALAQVLSHLGSNLPRDQNGGFLVDELKNAKNVSLAFVTATVPATGGSGGDRLNCTVSAIGKTKSLEGGVLLLTPLLGPRPTNRRIYAFAQGRIQLDGDSALTGGRIHGGCRLEEDFHNEFIKDGRITLVLKPQYAGFSIAQDIADSLRNEPDLRTSSGPDVDEMAVARDASHIEVSIPPQYAAVPVEFLALVESVRIYPPQTEARVVINERTGTVVIGEEVEIGPVAVTHGRFAVEAGPFFALDSSASAAATRLQSLVDALNALEASPQDIIDIIKSLESTGKLYGTLIIEK